MQKTLNVRFNTENENTVVSKVFRIDLDADDISLMDDFISWILENSRGIFNETGDIECKSKNDYIGCQKKALTLGLLQKVSLTEIRARSCAVK